ncbi:MAG: hypothetical protein CMO81_07155 [Waddliaceae bacterium]|nr:hypothetical protein [Waddliaceae bacterium]|tara:strand:- start:225 stop:662 length:438 start_codon:yes stop_codon:yes gene_type:complete
MVSQPGGFDDSIIPNAEIKEELEVSNQSEVENLQTENKITNIASNYVSHLSGNPIDESSKPIKAAKESESFDFSQIKKTLGLYVKQILKKVDDLVDPPPSSNKLDVAIGIISNNKTKGPDLKKQLEVIDLAIKKGVIVSSSSGKK